MPVEEKNADGTPKLAPGVTQETAEQSSQNGQPVGDSPEQFRTGVESLEYQEQQNTFDPNNAGGIDNNSSVQRASWAETIFQPEQTHRPLFGGTIDDEDDTYVVLRHQSIQRFQIGDFAFRNFELRLDSESKFEEFRNLMAQLPFNERNQIIVVNERAARQAAKPLFEKESSGVVRGAMQATDILTAKDRERLAAQNQSQNANDQGQGAGAVPRPSTTSTPTKPAGSALNMSSLLRK